MTELRATAAPVSDRLHPAQHQKNMVGKYLSTSAEDKDEKKVMGQGRC